MGRKRPQGECCTSWSQGRCGHLLPLRDIKKPHWSLWLSAVTWAADMI